MKNIKILLTIILTILIQAFTFGQSPLNYGQKKNVYFISTALRNNLEIKTIYIVDQRYDGDEGGMGQNWDITVINFDTNIISDSQSPIWIDSTFEYSFDSIREKIRFLNGYRYDFLDGNLISYGGEGYGSFEWKDFYRYPDNTSIVATSCVGHCGDLPVDYSKNIFNKKKQLSYRVTYPTPIVDNVLNKKGMSLQEFEKLINSNVTTKNNTDTLYYYYDDNGLLLNTSEENHINNISEVRLLFTNLDELSTSKFHQCYIGEMKMEIFVLKELGFIPKIILFEIYEQGVFSFTLNDSDKKYYRTKDVLLEQ